MSSLGQRNQWAEDKVGKRYQLAARFVESSPVVGNRVGSVTAVGPYNRNWSSSFPCMIFFS